MSRTLTRSILDQMLDPLARCFDGETARRLAEFHVDPEVDLRVTYLAERCNEGLLTPEEKEEYQAIVDASDMISILKLKARRYLKATEST